MSEPAHDPAAGRPTVADRATNRWRGVTGFALLAGGLGALYGRPALLLAAALGVVVAAYARVGGPPPVDLEAERDLGTVEAEPGERVRVTLTVRNVGDGTLPDLRLVDGVPDGLAVVEGSPRTGTALRPGKAATLSYVVEATRGEHSFDPVTVLARGFSGAVERETGVSADGPSLRCIPRLPEGVPVPLRMQTTQYTGRVATEAGGPGVEFHAVREYRHGDPMNRIDWGRLARGEALATVEYRQERAATVVLIVDTREGAFLGDGDAGASTLERSIAAAGEATTSLLATGDRVGLAAYGPVEGWLPPGAGEEHRARARRMLATHEAFAPTPVDRPFFAALRLARLRRRLPPDAQLVVFSPCADDYVASLARRLDAYGHRVTVVSPAPGGEGSPGRALARTERSIRLSELRSSGLRVVDWGPRRSR
jgi:uncharacterized repeat protein (TIGR01451 family)